MKANIHFRVSVVGLFIDGDTVLLLHQVTPPEPDCWDLPGGGLEPGERLLDGLRREIKEETGLEQFQVERLLTVVEGFFPQPQGQLLHTLNLIYQCSLDFKPLTFTSNDPEIGAKGIQWVAIADLNPEICSNRAWSALKAAGFINS